MRSVSIVVLMLSVVMVDACGNGTEPGAGLDGYCNSTWQASTINGQPLPYTWQDVQFQPIVDTTTIELKELEIRMGSRIGTNECGDAVGMGPPCDAG